MPNKKENGFFVPDQDSLQKLTRLAFETAVYGLGTIVPRLVNYLLVAPHTAIFDPGDYGAITNLYAYAGFLNVVFLFGMETAFFRYANKPGATVGQVFRQCQTVVLAVSAPLSLLLVLLAVPLAGAWGLNGQTEYIYYLAGILFIDAAVAIPFARWRQEKKALRFSVAKITNVLVLVGLNYLFLFSGWFDAAGGVRYVFLANLLANALFLLFVGKSLFSWRPAWHREQSKEMLRYAYPVMLMGLAGMTNEMFSRVAIRWWWPENFQGQSAQYALGVFGACYKYAVFMNLVVMAFRYAAEPFFFSHAADRQSPVLFAKVNHYFVVAGSFVVLAVTVNLDWLKWMLRSAAYHEGLDIVAVLLVAYLFLGVYYNLSVWFKITDRTHVGTWLTLVGAAITVAGNYLFIPVGGYYASAWVTLGCSGFMMVACYFLGQRHYPVPYRVFRGAAYLLLALVLIYVSNRWTLPLAWANVVYHFLLCLFYLAVVWWVERKDFSRGAV